MTPLFLQSLGGLELRGPEGELLGGRRKELALLVYLARRPSARASRDELVELLWGDRPQANARQSLRQALLHVRHAAAELISVEPDRVALMDGRVELDLAAFESDIEHGRYAEAVACWRGDFLAGAEDLGGETCRLWIEAEREGARKRLVRALEYLMSDAEGRGARQEAVEWAARWASAAPLDERAHRRWIEALALAGRVDEARDRHAAFVARVRKELEHEPSLDFLRLAAGLERAARPRHAGRPSPGSTALFTPDLVGRGSALDQLDAAWRDARSGSATLLLVEGEEGMGKTRLCEEFVRLASERAERILVLHARGNEAAQDAPGGVARELLGGLRDAPALVAAPAGALAALGNVVPGLRDRIARTLPPSTAWPADEAVARVLSDVAAETPILVFLDDFPAADPATQHLVVAAAQRLRKAPVLLLLTARVGEPAPCAAWTALQETYGARTLRLQALDAAQVDGLLRSMLEVPPDQREALAQRLHSDSGGNPFFAIQLLATLLDEGYLLPDAEGTWHLAALPDKAFSVPASLREAIDRRLDQLGDSARRTAEAAAVLAKPADVTLLGEVAAGSLAELEPALEELLGRRLLRVAPQRPGGYEFAHDISRRVAYQRLTPARREALHRAALRALRRRAGTGQVATTTLRYHRSRSGSPFRVLTRRPLVRVAVAVTGGLVLILALLRSPPAAPAVLAVGGIRDYTGDSAGVGRAIPDMLATNLARVPGVNVVSNARMYELLARLGMSESRESAFGRAASQAGATEVIEGALYRQPAGTLRLDLRRVALRSGKVVAAYTVAGGDPFTLVDSATALLADALDRPAATLRIADVTTRSLVAYRLYEEGLRAYYREDPRSAYRLFRAALAEDSSFAMAAYYASRVAPQYTASDLLSRAVALAARTSERERLLIRVARGWSLLDQATVAMAESLMARYPAEPEGHLLVAQALSTGGDHLGAVPHLLRVLAMDSLSLQGRSARCLACEAVGALVWSYLSLDSAREATRIARRWAALRPDQSGPWWHLAVALAYQGRYQDALGISRKLDSLRPDQADVNIFPVEIALRRGDFGEADQILAARARSGSRDVQLDALWTWTLSLRYQGRLREAMSLARRFRWLETSKEVASVRPSIPEAQVLFEQLRYREAAAGFDSIQRLGSEPGRERARRLMLQEAAFTPVSRADTLRLVGLADSVRISGNAHYRAWYLTHMGTAIAAANDSARLRPLADSIEAIGHTSLFGRDRRIHYYVRGLLLQQRGRWPEAVEAFRQALLPFDFTRINLELGRSLLETGRAMDAIPILRAGVNGPLGVRGFYCTLTELHELLGRAYDAAGQPDSAAAHYRWVVNAWRNGDPEFIPRRRAIEARLVALEPPLPHP